MKPIILVPALICCAGTLGCASTATMTPEQMEAGVPAILCTHVETLTMTVQTVYVQGPANALSVNADCGVQVLPSVSPAVPGLQIDVPLAPAKP